jgi:hypothetical protein
MKDSNNAENIASSGSIFEVERSDAEDIVTQPQAESTIVMKGLAKTLKAPEIFDEFIVATTLREWSE